MLVFVFNKNRYLTYYFFLISLTSLYSLKVQVRSRVHFTSSFKSKKKLTFYIKHKKKITIKNLVQKNNKVVSTC